MEAVHDGAKAVFHVAGASEGVCLRGGKGGSTAVGRAVG